MYNFWDSHPNGDKKLLHLLTNTGKWLAWPDREADPEDAGSKRIAGCCEQITDILNDAIHSTNVVVLLGSGASFCAKNEGETNAPSMYDLWEAVKNDCGENEFNGVVKIIMGGIPEKENIEELLSLAKMTLEIINVKSKTDDLFVECEKKEKISKFISLAEDTILREVSFVNEKTELPAHILFIRKFSRRSSEKPRVKLFTTNYDLCIENAASRLGVVLIDGFSHSSVQRFNQNYFQNDIIRRTGSGTKAEYLDGVFHLYKLHGSVDWRRQTNGSVIRSEKTTSSCQKPVLIYPRSTKYQEAFETPYLDMFAALQSALREPDTTLIISGFGFADDHISAPIWSAIETNLSVRVILCDRGFIPKEQLDGLDTHEIDLDIEFQKDYQKKIISLVQDGDSRISVINGRFEDLAQAIPEISGKTDRQLLQDRLNRLSGLES